MPNVSGIEKLVNLKMLSMWKYKPKSRDLTYINMLTSIEKLGIIQSSITSLKGLEGFKNLRELTLAYSPKLEYLDTIEHFQNSLEVLECDVCRNLKNYDYIGKLSNLETLRLSKCGDIQSLKFIKSLPLLKFLVFLQMNVVDGDLSPCVGIEYVRFTDKKHYSHKCKDFIKT
ncbi:MAG: hypothetical protein IJP31_11540 [Lachnospiraceae bacterium]|nr:hypothetical protein [Lachnospiraceae bacterium]